MPDLTAESQVFKWLDTCRRTCNAMDEAGIDIEEAGLCFQCDHATGTKRIAQIHGIDFWFCHRCWQRIGEYMRDDR